VITTDVVSVPSEFTMAEASYLDSDKTMDTTNYVNFLMTTDAIRTTLVAAQNEQGAKGTSVPLKTQPWGRIIYAILRIHLACL